MESPKRDQTDHAHNYWRGQVFPRARNLILDWGTAASLVGGVITVWIISTGGSQGTPIQDVAGAVLDYAAIGFGACVTALVLAISLAPTERVQRWSTRYPHGHEFSTYSELIFVLSWSAAVQLFTVLIAFISKFVGGSIAVWPHDPLRSHVILLWLAASTVIYALWQVATVVATLSMIGAVTAQEAQSDVRNQEHRSDAETDEN